MVGGWEPVLNYFFSIAKAWQVTKFISCYFRSTFESDLWMWLPLFKTGITWFRVINVLTGTVIHLRTKEMGLLTLHMAPNGTSGISRVSPNVSGPPEFAGIGIFILQ